MGTSLLVSCWRFSTLSKLSKCFEKWGASAVAKRIDDIILNEFGSERMWPEPTDGLFRHVSVDTSDENYSKKRLLYN